MTDAWARSRPPAWMPYPSQAREIAQQWADSVFTELNWQPDPTRAFKTGEAGGFLARAPNFEFSGYLKPTKSEQDAPRRAANEKIAADLAFRLEIQVPPVLLYRRINCPEDEEARACISLVIYPQQHEWGNLANAPHDDALGEIVWAALAPSCGIIAFDTYLGNTDRNNPRNAVWGFDPNDRSRATFVYLDFANSMNFDGRWVNGGWANVGAAPVFSPMERAVDRKILRKTVKRIERLPDHSIRSVVDRIPDDYMNPEHREAVIEGLLSRREMVKELIANRVQIQ